MELQPQLLQDCSYQGKQASQFLGKCAEAQSITHRYLTHKQILQSKNFTKLLVKPNEYEKTAVFNSFTQDREETQQFNYFSICDSTNETDIIKSIYALKEGISSIVNGDSNQLMKAINITAAAQKQTIGVTSRFIIVCDSSIRQKVQKAIDQVIKVHELTIDCCKQGKTCKQVLDDVAKLHVESSMSYGDDFQLNYDFPMLNNINFSGFTVQGLGTQ